jgi:hypothetical protein
MASGNYLPRQRLVMISGDQNGNGQHDGREPHRDRRAGSARQKPAPGTNEEDTALLHDLLQQDAESE